MKNFFANPLGNFKGLKLEFGYISLITILYSLSAFNSVGYHQADEHYQLIEFASFKLGLTSASQLAWEFNKGIRSAVQPALAYILINLIKKFGVNDPHSVICILRFITAGFAIYAIFQFINSTIYMINERHRSLFVNLSFLFWPLFYWNVRFSSETWGGLSFLLALSYFVNDARSPSWKNKLWTIVLLSVSILFRFQIVALCIILAAWTTVVQKRIALAAGILISTLVLMLSLCVIIDHWLYGKWIISIYNYFIVNWVNGVASNYGTAPIFFYFFEILHGLTFPIGTFVLICCAYLFYRRPNNLFIWLTLGFVLVHCLVPHKETRFLVPILNLVPIIIVLALDECKDCMQTKSAPVQHVIRICVLALFVANVGGSLITIFAPAGDGRSVITKYLNRKFDNLNITVLHTENADPYTPWKGLTAQFYLKPKVKSFEIVSLCGLTQTPLIKVGVTIVIVKNSDLDNPYCTSNLNRLGFRQTLQSIPAWVLVLLKFYRAPPDYLILFER